MDSPSDFLEGGWIEDVAEEMPVNVQWFAILCLLFNFFSLYISYVYFLEIAWNSCGLLCPFLLFIFIIENNAIFHPLQTYQTQSWP